MRLFLLAGILSISTVLFGETKLTTTQYIDQWKKTAVEQMQLYRIPASITLAQGILESGSGNSRLAKEAKNHFGIKCHKTWSGDTFIQDDDTKDECFRSYYSAKDSYRDHSLFLSKRSRYERLFQLRLDNYKGWAKGLKAAGYATNPKYAYLLIDLIERYHLNQYDKMTLKEVSSVRNPKHQPVAKPVEKVKTTKKAPSKVVIPAPVYKSEPSTVEIKERSHIVTTSLNKVRYVEVREGDTFYRIAREFDMTIGQLYKYNEFKNKDVLEVGDRIYISPKRTKGPRGNSNYVCQKDMSLREIAHEQGIKLNSLMKLNLSENPDQLISKGSKVTLR